MDKLNKWRNYPFIFRPISLSGDYITIPGITGSLAQRRAENKAGQQGSFLKGQNNLNKRAIRDCLILSALLTGSKAAGDMGSAKP